MATASNRVTVASSEYTTLPFSATNRVTNNIGSGTAVAISPTFALTASHVMSGATDTFATLPFRLTNVPVTDKNQTDVRDTYVTTFDPFGVAETNENDLMLVETTNTFSSTSLVGFGYFVNPADLASRTVSTAGFVGNTMQKATGVVTQAGDASTMAEANIYTQPGHSGSGIFFRDTNLTGTTELFTVGVLGDSLARPTVVRCLIN